MRTAPTDELAEIRRIAALLDCFLDEDLQLIAGVTGSTTDAWRRRGKGPPYVLLGNRFIYPRQPAIEHVHALVRERSLPVGKGAL